MKEVYKDIYGYEGYYQVSDIGNIKSLERMIPHRGGGLAKIKGKIMKTFPNNEGYLRVNLYKNGKRRQFYVHQLMAMAFLNHTPNGHTMVVDHRDGVKHHNILSNIEIVTHRENVTICTRNYVTKLSSKCIGVDYVKSRNTWRAIIYLNGKYIYLGTFSTEEEAGAAYKGAMKVIDHLMVNL